jgi:DNA-binding CsgD family transcriptional regulator
MIDRWPLVGRSAELASISHAVGDPSVRSVVLVGPAGVGKTRLASESLRLTAERGFVAARVLATRSASRLPLGALAPLLPALDEPDDGQVDALRRARVAVLARGRGAPLALLVDDAHLLDDLSATLTWQLAEAGEAFVIATVRRDEPVPDPIVALWKEEVGMRIDVRPLDLEAIGELLSTVLDGSVDARTVHLLGQHSGGNPLYLRELVTAALDTGALRKQTPDAWRLVDGLVLSERLVEIVEARIGSLRDREREALELVAYGEPLPVGALHPEEASALATLERRGLVRVGHEGRRVVATLGHPLYGDVVRSRTPTLSARLVNNRLADLVEQKGGRRREDPLRFAQWRIDGGGTAQPGLMLRAAQAARKHSDVALARRLAQAAVEAGARFDGELLAAQLCVLEGRVEDAELLFAQLTSRAETDDQRTTLAVNRIENLLVGLARPEEALRVADDAAVTVSEAYSADQLAAVRAQLLYHLGRSGAALAVADPILDRVQGRALIQLTPTATLALMDSGRLSRAVEVASRGYEAHLGWDGPPPTFGPQMHLVPRAVALAYLGRLAEAEEDAQRGHADAVANGSVEAQANFAQLLGWILIVRGNATAGGRYMAESLSLYRELGWKVYVMFALANLAHAEALRGDADAASRALAELDALEIPEAHDLGHPLVAQARAWVAVAGGDLGSARRRLLAGAEAARRSENRVLEVVLLHDVARLGAPGDVAGRLIELTGIVEGEFVIARAEYAAALDRGDPAGMEAVAERFEQLGAWLFAAEAAAGAAVLLRRSGDKRRATLLERSSAELVRKCEGAFTPALRNVESQAILSARELEVASLAAAGLSNRAIADRLFVSVRTVETQLQHVYRKLGVSSRGDLSHVLDPS